MRRGDAAIPRSRPTSPPRNRKSPDSPASPFGTATEPAPYHWPPRLPWCPVTGMPAGEIRPTQIDFGDALARAWAAFSDGWLAVLGALLLMLLVEAACYFVMASGAAVIGAAVQDRAVTKTLASLVQFGSTLLSLWLNIGLQVFILGVVRGEEPRYGLLFSGGRQLLPVVVCVILSALIVAAGMLLLIVPA